ncbi:PDR/VanB family oxidoreductase [Arthrobacter sp. ISL-28]|uniref:PDR/VanB family oxidoreductase n=1 Tax=Arthrobacter sp. ISL-28 TaxID=2819108 RepID=UPI001BEA517D|nr:PDR/VanB family oxidoreductase [Arthrobacter sp. ISL-28]MBT2523483.1 oxidoreductase [Arthrobacter sp. ISL-28]
MNEISSATLAERTPGSTLRIATREVAAEGLITLDLERADGGRLPDSTPGAHIDVMLGNGLTRQYSLCGDPRDAHRYRVAVLREPDGRGGSASIHDELTVGSTVGLGGPRNNFAIVPSNRYKFIAGGVGITPILPMIVAADQLGASWELLYLGRRRETMAFLDDLVRYGDRVTIHTSADSGRADLAAWIGATDPDTKVFVCGPTGLLDEVEASTISWRTGWVRLERFQAARHPAPVRTAPFEIELARTGRLVTVNPDVTVAEAIRDAGATVLTSCGQGVCGTCEVSLLAGEADHRDAILDDSERQAQNCMFVCLSRALTDRLVLDA